jgi:hypothetical protein
MKITRIQGVSVGSTAGGSPSGPAGGDTGGTYPTPQVTGILGHPIAGTPADGDVIVYDAASGTWILEVPSPGGLDSVTDGVTTVSPATELTLREGGVEDGGSGDAILHVLTSRDGAQDDLSTVATSGSAQTLDPSTANVFDVTLTAACTISLGTTPSGQACAITVILRQDATGGRTVTWPGSVSWISGSAPILQTAASAVDVVTLFTVDGGTSWGGIAAGSGSGATLVPATVYDGSNWLPLVDGSGNCIMIPA